MPRQQQMSRWVIRAGPGFYIAQDGTETTHKIESANYSTAEAAKGFAKQMNIELDGAIRYVVQMEFRDNEVRG